MKYTRETLIKYIDDCRKNEKRIDLSEQDLSGLNMSYLDLRGANLHEADLHEADLRGANLQWADLQWTDLQWTDLQRANLQRADLHEADLRGADLDFTGFNLSCNSIGIKCDSRLVSQLLYHLCRLDVSDCPEWADLRNDERLMALANKSHVITTHNLPMITKDGDK